MSEVMNELDLYMAAMAFVLLAPPLGFLVYFVAQSHGWFGVAILCGVFLWVVIPAALYGKAMSAVEQSNEERFHNYTGNE